MKIEVYWNLHKKLFSVRHKGKVVKHLRKVSVRNAKLVVQEGGRQRVLREQKKNVHAIVRGEYIDVRPIWLRKKASYNPYFAGYFFNKKTKEPVSKADYVNLDIKDGKPVITYDNVIPNFKERAW